MNPVRSSTSSSERIRPGVLAAFVCALIVAVGHVVFATPPPLDTEAGAMEPFANAVYQIAPRYAVGVSPRSRVVRNAQGLRGSLLHGKPDDVLVVGGSTVACTLLDEQDALGRRIELASNERFHVAVAGRGGHPLGRLLRLVEQVLDRPDLRPGIVVGLFGASEVEFFLNSVPWERDATGTPIPGFDPNGPYGPDRWATTFAGWYRPGNHGAFLERPRRAYAQAHKVEGLGPLQMRALQEALAAYRSDLEAFVDLAHERGARVVLATQPLAPAGPHYAPFFHGRPGYGVLPTPRLLRSVLEAFNGQMRSVARRRGIALVDLARTLDDCTACFYDQWHFTVVGAREAAQHIAAALDRVAAGAHRARPADQSHAMGT